MKDYSPLYAKLGYQFQDESLLTRALTHASKSGAYNYERLEFLGDRVLGFVIADILYEKFPNEPEGKLARRFANLVRQETLVEIAQEMNLSKYLLLSKGEQKMQGRYKDSLLSDCCESLLAAIYIDAGIETVRKVIGKYWMPYTRSSDLDKKDAKSTLQEIVQGQGKSLPVYEVIEAVGPSHNPVYKIEVRVEGFESTIGTGPSKRIAEQAAAAALLKKIKSGFSDG